MSLPDETVPWDMVAAVRSADSRKEVFIGIANEPRCASRVADDLDLSRDAVTSHFHYLKKQGLARCLTPDRPHHRIYGITQKGKKVFDVL